MGFEIIRTSIATRLEEFCTEHGLSYLTQTRDYGHGLQLKFVIDGGEPLTPGEAASKYLDGE